MDAAIKPVHPEMQCIGPAYTVQVIKNDCSVVFKALRNAPAGSVLVVAALGTTDAAFMGEIIATIAAKKGLAGIVIDGGIRDSRAIRQGKLPVFARAITPKSPNVNYLGAVQKTVTCAGIIVRPGDLVSGDADGVVVVPIEKVEEVLAKAKAKAKEEKDIWKMTNVIPDEKALDEFLATASGDKD